MPVATLAAGAAASSSSYSARRRFNRLFGMGRGTKVHNGPDAGSAGAEMAPAPSEADPSAAPRTGTSSTLDRQQTDGKDLKAERGGRPEPLRRRIYNTFEDPSYSPLAKWLSIFMMFIILLSTICFILESEAENPAGILDEQPALVRCALLTHLCSARPHFPAAAPPRPESILYHRVDLGRPLHY